VKLGKTPVARRWISRFIATGRSCCVCINDWASTRCYERRRLGRCARYGEKFVRPSPMWAAGGVADFHRPSIPASRCPDATVIYEGPRPIDYDYPAVPAGW